MPFRLTLRKAAGRPLPISFRRVNKEGRYTNVMPSDNDAKSGGGRSWKSTLGVNEHSAEKRWDWITRGNGLDGDCLRATTPALPAVTQLDDGRRVFFNQLIAAFRGWKDARNDPSKSDSPLAVSPLGVEAVKHAVTISKPWLLTSFGKRALSHPEQYGMFMQTRNLLALQRFWLHLPASKPIALTQIAQEIDSEPETHPIMGWEQRNKQRLPRNYLRQNVETQIIRNDPATNQYLKSICK